MKRLLCSVFFLILCIWGGSAIADDQKDIPADTQEIVAPEGQDKLAGAQEIAPAAAQDLLPFAKEIVDEDPQDMMAVAKKIVAEDEARFGFSMKKCRLECGRVYSKEHCDDRCQEMAKRHRSLAYEREETERLLAEEEKPYQYKEVAEKYR
jgi:hypothetical protein